jgi:hypothetical protein
MSTDSSPIKAPTPETFTLEQGAGGLSISYRWFAPSYIFLAFFCLFWDGFLVFWYTIAFTQDAPWVMFVFPILHLGVGVGLTYTALAGFYNKTSVMVGQGKLSIQHSPLPWPGNRTFPATDIIQLYSEQRMVHSRNGTNARYQLSAITRDNRKIRLIANLNEPDKVRFLERKIEEYLGIQNRPVEGEMAG